MPVIRSAQDMEQALAQAEPRGPSGLPEPDPGAVLALACHCVMVNAGMTCTLPSGANPSNKWAPPPRWSIELKDEWVFRYSMPGKRNTLVLHCSLQRLSGRMLVHTIEVNNERNSHLLGLQLDKYVPDPSLLRNRDWSGVLQHSEALQSMMQQHVLAPLLEGAEDVPAGPGLTSAGSWASDGSSSSWWGWMSNKPAGAAGAAGGSSGSYVVPALVVAGLALAVVGVYAARKRRRGS